MGSLKDLWEMLGKFLPWRNIDDQKKWEEIYQARIKFLQDELEARKAEIEELKKKHPGNDKDVILDNELSAINWDSSSCPYQNI